MNILLISQFLSTTKGGGEYVFSLIANGLAKRGHKVWIITHRIENEDYSNFHKNVRIEFVSSIKYEGGLPPSFRDNINFVLQVIVKGLQIISKEKIELIHSSRRYQCYLRIGNHLIQIARGIENSEVIRSMHTIWKDN